MLQLLENDHTSPFICVFLTIFFIKRASLKQFFYIWNCYNWPQFTTPNSKNIIATLHIATIEKVELTFLLILYFHVIINIFIGNDFYDCKNV